MVSPDHCLVQRAETHKEENRLPGRWSLDRKDDAMTLEPFLSPWSAPPLGGLCETRAYLYVTKGYVQRVLTFPLQTR
jgi:hypothetical protein